jgi:hypothetical protein
MLDNALLTFFKDSHLEKLLISPQKCKFLILVKEIKNYQKKFG